MKQKLLAIAVAPVMAVAATVGAVTLTIDGTVQGDFDKLTIEQTAAGVVITTGTDTSTDTGTDTGTDTDHRHRWHRHRHRHRHR